MVQMPKNEISEVQLWSEGCTAIIVFGFFALIIFLVMSPPFIDGIFGTHIVESIQRMRH